MTTKHVIIGGGPAAANAIETIRQYDDGQSQITLISDEPSHSRMAIPYWIAGSIPREQTHIGDAAHFEKLGVDARIGARASNIDTAAKQVTLDDGASLAYDNLLLATGSSPLKPPIEGADLPGVQPLWSLAHAESALALAESKTNPRVVLVGAGFIGFIVLGAMHKRGWSLTVVERESQVLPRMLDEQAATLAQSWLSQQNVAVHTSVEVQAIRETADGKVVELADGRKIEADLVILSTGVRPNTELAAAADIAVDHGVLVDDRMQTNQPGVFAAGDVAQGPNLLGGESEIHAIQPTAVDHGRIAGANMAGKETRYGGSLLMNVVDICGLHAASFGDWDDASAEVMTVSSPAGYVYRKLLWSEDRLTGAIFAGRPSDMGMLTDVGMVKGMIQTQTPLGEWKQHLAANPFDVRRAYIGAGVAQKLRGATLLGGPSKPRGFRYDNAQVRSSAGPGHPSYVGTQAE